jgi:hypothetical protein
MSLTKLRGSQHRREARCGPGRLTPRGLSLSFRRMRRCLRSGGVPGYRNSSRAGTSDAAQQARFGVLRFREETQQATSLRLCSPDLASQEAWRESLPYPFPLRRCRLRGCDAASPWPVVARPAFLPEGRSAVLRRPFRLHTESLPHVPPAPEPSVSGRSACGGSRFSPIRGLRHEPGPSRAVMPSQT